MGKKKTSKTVVEVATENKAAEVVANESANTNNANTTTQVEPAAPAPKKNKKGSVTYGEFADTDTAEEEIKKARPVLWDVLMDYQPAQGYSTWAAHRMLSNLTKRFPQEVLYAIFSEEKKTIEETAESTVLYLGLSKIDITVKLGATSEERTFSLLITSKTTGEEGEEVITYSSCATYEEAKKYIKGEDAVEMAKKILNTKPTQEGMNQLIKLKEENPDNELLVKAVNAYTFAFNSEKQLGLIVAQFDK